MKITNRFLPFLLLVYLIVLGGSTSYGQNVDQCSSVHGVLRELRSNTDQFPKNLGSLFAKGDACFSVIERSFNDEVLEVSLAAQTIVRYLGDPASIRRLDDWCQRPANRCLVSGPVSVPVPAAQMIFIDSQIRDLAICDWSENELSLLVAVSLDESENAKKLVASFLNRTKACSNDKPLVQLLRKWKLDKVGHAILDSSDLAGSALESAFFLEAGDKKNASSNLLAFNGARTRALVHIRVNNGLLAEKQYYLVLQRVRREWKFAVVHLDSVS